MVRPAYRSDCAARPPGQYEAGHRKGAATAEEGQDDAQHHSPHVLVLPLQADGARRGRSRLPGVWLLDFHASLAV